MKKRIGNMFGTLSNGPRTRSNRLRALQMESLEGRRLLAADLAPNHNYLIAEDVNQDFQVSPLDALLVVNAINGRGSAGGEGEDSENRTKPDVNGDGIISAADVLGIINLLNGEGEGGVLVSYRHEITDLNGSPIPVVNGVPQVAVGQSFRINTFVRDARDLPENPDPRLYGVYSAAIDMGVTNLDLVEYKIPGSDPDPFDSRDLPFAYAATFGQFFINDQGVNEGGGIQINGTTQADVVDGQQFTLDAGNGPITFEFDWDSSISAGVETITIRNPSDSNPADPLTFQEVGNAMVTAINNSGLGVTAAYNGQGVVGIDLDQVTFGASSSNLTQSLVTVEYFNEVKSFLDSSRSPDPAGELLFYSVDFDALTPGTVTFTPDGPDRPGSENLLYGDQTVIPNNMIMFGSAFDLRIIADATAPVAMDDIVTTAEDQARVLVDADLLPNDQVTSPRTKSLVSISTISGTTLGTLNGSTYTPPANYFGQDLLQYTMQDSTGLQSSATITINVTPVNDPPVAVNDAFSVDEDSTDNLLEGRLATNNGILDNDNGGPNEASDTLTITAVGTPDNGGTVTIAANSVDLIYTPAATFVGTETFTYTISDQDGATATATISVDVAPLTLPRARTDRATVVEDSTSNVIDVLANDSANEGAGKILSSIGTNPSNGTVTIDDQGNSDPADDVIRYTPNADFSGTDTFTYVMTDDVQDPVSTPSTGTVIVTVTAVNDPVVLNDDTATTDEDVTATIPVTTLLANDSPGAGESSSQTLTITGVTATSAGGSVALVGNNVVYTPTANFNGQFTFTYSASDNGSPVSSGTATVVVTVNPVNDNPVAGADTVNTVEDVPGFAITAASLLANDNAGPGETQTLSITGVSSSSSKGGTVSLSGTTITYTPAANYNSDDGVDTFTYTLSDGNGGTATGTVTVNVAPINDAPIAGTDSATAFKDNVATIQTSTLLANDSPGPANESTQTLSVVSVTATADTHGTVVLNADGTITYTPDDGYTGSASFQYGLQDSGSGVSPNVNSSTGTVNVNVQEFLPSKIGGTVWVDETRDGKIDDAERRLEGIYVTLTGMTLGQPIQAMTMITLADGTYSFDDLGPGTYTVSYVNPHYMLENTDVPDSYDVSIVAPGGVNDLDNNFAALGLEGNYARTLDQLASRYVMSNESLAYNGAYFAIGSDNSLLWGAHLDGYEGIGFSEAVISGNTLLLSVVDSSHNVYSARLGAGEYVSVKTDNGATLIRVLGDQTRFDWQLVDRANPPLESAPKYLDAIDAIFDQENWDDV